MVCFFFQNGAVIDNFFLIKNFNASNNAEHQSNITVDAHHYSLQPHHEILRTINQRKKEKKKIDFYPFPIIEIIVG